MNTTTSFRNFPVLVMLTDAVIIRFPSAASSSLSDSIVHDMFRFTELRHPQPEETDSDAHPFLGEMSGERMTDSQYVFPQLLIRRGLGDSSGKSIARHTQQIKRRGGGSSLPFFFLLLLMYKYKAHRAEKKSRLCIDPVLSIKPGINAGVAC